MIAERQRLPEQTDLAYVLEPARIYSSRALRRVLGCTQQYASNLWQGHAPITGRIALDLSEATGMPAEVFLRLNAKFGRTA